MIYYHFHVYIYFFDDVFVINNFENFQTNSSLHCINTRLKIQLHRPTVNLSCIQKGVIYSCIKLFNSLPNNILKLQNNANFKIAWWRYLILFILLSIFSFIARKSCINPNNLMYNVESLLCGSWIYINSDIIVLCLLLCSMFLFVGPCHHGMARPRVADGGTASHMEGSCE